MTDTASLLPPNAPALARAAEGVLRQHLSAIGQPHRALWNPATCPLPLLPWLAWAVGAEDWDRSWNEAQQRSMVAAAIQINKKKGTTWAIKTALHRSGLDNVHLSERPPGAHWAEFDLAIDITDRPLGEAAVQRILTLVGNTKPVRSHLRRLRITLSQPGPLYIGAALHSWGRTSVYPRPLATPAPPTAQPHIGAALALGERTTLYPAPAPAGPPPAHPHIGAVQALKELTTVYPPAP